MDERRKHKRFKVHESIAEPVDIVFSPPFYQQTITGTIINISAGGVEMFINDPLPKHFIYSFYIRLHGIKPFEAKGKVTRLEKDIGQYNISIVFTEIDVKYAEMLNLAVEDNAKCIKERTGSNKDFCFNECKFSTLCINKNKSAADTARKHSEINIKNIEKQDFKV